LEAETEEVVVATIEAAAAVKAAAMVRMAAMMAETAEVDITDRKGSSSGRDGGGSIVEGMLVHK
jgi:hypothetical protein